MGAARSLGRHWLGTWFEAKQACGVGEMAHRYALVARTAEGNTAEPQQVGTWRMDGRARTHRRGFLLSNPLQTKMGMGTWLEACRVGEMASKHVALERWLIDTPWLLEPPKAIQQNPSRWEHGGWMDVPVRIEEASYFRTRCKQRWEWVHGSKPVALVRWQAGKAVNASRFPCASPSAKAEGSADNRDNHDDNNM